MRKNFIDPSSSTDAEIRGYLRSGDFSLLLFIAENAEDISEQKLEILNDKDLFDEIERKIRSDAEEEKVENLSDFWGEIDLCETDRIAEVYRLSEADLRVIYSDARAFVMRYFQGNYSDYIVFKTKKYEPSRKQTYKLARLFTRSFIEALCLDEDCFKNIEPQPDIEEDVISTFADIYAKNKPGKIADVLRGIVEGEIDPIILMEVLDRNPDYNNCDPDVDFYEMLKTFCDFNSVAGIVYSLSSPTMDQIKKALLDEAREIKETVGWSELLGVLCYAVI